MAPLVRLFSLRSSFIYLLALLLACILLLQCPLSCDAFWSAAEEEENQQQQQRQQQSAVLEYGVDVSFPMHHSKVSDNYAWLPHNLDPSLPVPDRYKGMVVQPLGNRQAAYDEFLNGCVKAFGNKGSRCTSTERDRIEMTLRQPAGMVNYTEVGYKKIKAPDKVFKLIKEFWDRNKDKEKPENWGAGNTYTNNWIVPSTMVSVEDTSLRGGGYQLKQAIWEAARDTISAWTGQELTQCSLYGIRVYKEGSILSPHVDRLPLVSSAIINVAQDVDEPWPLEVISHSGKAENVTMLPGEMVLYESHSVIHGRPYPLKGRYMANIFIHFEPTGHTLRHNIANGGAAIDSVFDVDRQYRKALEMAHGGHENEEQEKKQDRNGLPPYVILGSEEEGHWRQQHPSGPTSTTTKRLQSFTTGSTEAHTAAQKGDLDELKGHVARDKKVVHAVDSNGWTPLHEGARGGHLDVVKYLVENGADVNALTHGTGATALWWAKQQHGEDHPVIDYLISMGAIESGPEL